MADKQRRIQKLIESIISYLQTHRGGTPGVDLTLNKLVATDLSEKSFIDMPPKTRHDEVLKNAIGRITAPELQKSQIVCKAPKTIWSGARITLCSTHPAQIWVRGTRNATCILC